MIYYAQDSNLSMKKSEKTLNEKLAEGKFVSESRETSIAFCFHFSEILKEITLLTVCVH